jgi:predicted RNase H-like HicB family nuclease
MLYLKYSIDRRKGVMVEVRVTLTAVVTEEEDMFVANCPEVGTVSQGRTIQEAIDNLKEATELYLDEFPEKIPEPTHLRPLVTTFEALSAKVA